MATKAFSLLECLLTLCLIAFFAAIAFVNWQWYQRNHQANLAIQSLYQDLNTAQMLAVSRQQVLSLCPSLDHQHCQAPWSGELLVFAGPFDPSQAQQSPIAFLPLAIDHGHLQWRHFSQQPWLTFDTAGRLQDDNGTWLYCPAIDNAAFNRALSINRLGRIRLLTKRNTEGQLIDSDDRALACRSDDLRNTL